MLTLESYIELNEAKTKAISARNARKAMMEVLAWSEDKNAIMYNQTLTQMQTEFFRLFKTKKPVVGTPGQDDAMYKIADVRNIFKHKNMIMAERKNIVDKIDIKKFGDKYVETVEINKAPAVELNDVQRRMLGVGEGGFSDQSPLAKEMKLTTKDFGALIDLGYMEYKGGRYFTTRAGKKANK